MQKIEKYSRKREAIYHTIAQTKTHPSAEWVYTKVREQYPDISLGTVYRNIARFKAENKLISVAVVAGQERVDADISDHAHFVCQNCGDVIDVQGPDVTDAYDALEEEFGCTVERHNLVFYGICNECSDSEY